MLARHTHLRFKRSRPPSQRGALATDKYLALKVNVERSRQSVPLIHLDLPVVARPR